MQAVLKKTISVPVFKTSPLNSGQIVPKSRHVCLCREYSLYLPSWDVSVRICWSTEVERVSVRMYVVIYSPIPESFTIIYSIIDE